MVLTVTGRGRECRAEGSFAFAKRLGRGKTSCSPARGGRKAATSRVCRPLKPTGRPAAAADLRSPKEGAASLKLRQERFDRFGREDAGELLVQALELVGEAGVVDPHAVQN